MEIRVRFYYGADILPYILPDFLLSIQDWELGLAARTKKMGKRASRPLVGWIGVGLLLILIFIPAFCSHFRFAICQKISCIGWRRGWFNCLFLTRSDVMRVKYPRFMTAGGHFSDSGWLTDFNGAAYCISLGVLYWDWLMGGI
jgi:hypothetical protein